ncbi:MAG TPA: 16S rRNA (guanine(527)-N(7))-methyltransferase RsmG [Alphaproteobacteria bacterium]|nr:16S rRNA (guanine(527)-N(7))-methyltransferase RsmG [Alphaproteobacteria bacterium]
MAQTAIYIDLLLKWNARVNLTGVRDPSEMVTRHFGESFFVARTLLRTGESSTVIDLGSGAGFPGMPMAMFAPAANVTLIESNTRKAAFLKEAVFALKLKNVAVFSGRAEDYRGQASLVVMRAVEKFERSLTLALSLVEAGGRIGLMIGDAQVEKAKALRPGLAWNEPIDMPSGQSRVLLVGTKVVKVERA